MKTSSYHSGAWRSHLGETAMLAMAGGASSWETEAHLDECDECRVVLATLMQKPARARKLPEPGELFAKRFLIGERLGSGAVGTVFAADDRVIGGPVALKVLGPSVCDDTKVLSTVLREADVSRRLRHANVRQVFDIQQHDELSFLVMELVRGVTLERYAARRLPTADAHVILAQIARGLAAAHAVGIVHRDVKPSNVLIEDGGRVLLTDFGLACALGPAASLFRASGVVGTPLFWSPEQSRGEPATAASDVYSFGLLAHWLLTGSPLSLNAPIPVERGYRRLVRRCLELQPADRYPNGARLLEALEASPFRVRATRGALVTATTVAAAFCVAAACGVTLGEAQANRAAMTQASPPKPGPAVVSEVVAAEAPGQRAAPSVSVDDLPSAARPERSRASRAMRSPPPRGATDASARSPRTSPSAPRAAEDGVPRAGSPATAAATDIDRESPYAHSSR